MSGQDIGFFDVGANCIDLVIENGDLKADDGLETMVFISFFSDRFVEVEDLPAGHNQDDQRGWFADLVSETNGDRIGSRFWTLERVKMTENPNLSLIEFAKESLQWMIDDGVAAAINAAAEKNGIDSVSLTVEIIRPDGSNPNFQFLWENQELKRMAA